MAEQSEEKWEFAWDCRATHAIPGTMNENRYWPLRVSVTAPSYAEAHKKLCDALQKLVDEP